MLTPSACLQCEELLFCQRNVCQRNGDHRALVARPSVLNTSPRESLHQGSRPISCGRKSLPRKLNCTALGQRARSALGEELESLRYRWRFTGVIWAFQDDVKKSLEEGSWGLCPGVPPRKKKSEKRGVPPKKSQKRVENGVKNLLKPEKNVNFWWFSGFLGPRAQEARNP